VHAIVVATNRSTHSFKEVSTPNHFTKALETARIIHPEESTALLNSRVEEILKGACIKIVKDGTSLNCASAQYFGLQNELYWMKHWNQPESSLETALQILEEEWKLSRVCYRHSLTDVTAMSSI